MNKRFLFTTNIKLLSYYYQNNFFYLKWIKVLIETQGQWTVVHKYYIFHDIKNPFNIDKLHPLYFPCLAACLFVCLFCLAPSFMRSFFPSSSFIICLLTDLLIDLFLPSVHLLTTAHACWSVPSRKYFKNARDWCSDTDKNTRELRVTPREEGEKYKVAKRYKTRAVQSEKQFNLSCYLEGAALLFHFNEMCPWQVPSN